MCSNAAHCEWQKQLWMLHRVKKATGVSHSPVVNCDVSLQVELAMMELDDRETGAADHVDFVHAGDAASEDCWNQVQDLGWSGSH